jgi:hypothetical protein
MIPEKITFRPGNLAGAMGKKLDASGESPSDYVRRLIAEDLGRKPPAMDGHIKTIKRVNKSRARRPRSPRE